MEIRDAHWWQTQAERYKARCQLLDDENDELRERMRILTSLSEYDASLQVVFGLTGKENLIVSLLMKRDNCTREALMQIMYAHNPESGVEVKIIDVFVCKIRKKLKKYRIQITTVWGKGYLIDAVTKDRIRKLTADFIETVPTPVLT